MDRLTQVALNSMRLLADNQRVVASNLANQNTIGFRKDLPSNLTSVYLHGEQGLDDRVFASRGQTGVDAQSGTLIPTDRPLDIAVEGDGYIVGQNAKGEDVITRRGDLSVTADRKLRNGEGLLIMGDQGPITVPPYSNIDIARDGTISVQPFGAAAGESIAAGRVKLVSVPADNIQKGLDGFMRPMDGKTPAADAKVQINAKYLEASNVNSVDSMVDMIETTRSYEMKVKLLAMAKDLDTETAKLMRSNQ